MGQTELGFRTSMDVATIMMAIHPGDLGASGVRHLSRQKILLCEYRLDQVVRRPKIVRTQPPSDVLSAIGELIWPGSQDGYDLELESSIIPAKCKGCAVSTSCLAAIALLNYLEAAARLKYREIGFDLDKVQVEHQVGLDDKRLLFRGEIHGQGGPYLCTQNIVFRSQCIETDLQLALISRGNKGR